MTRPAAIPGLVAASLAAAACILPDRDIIIVDENVQNKHPVRFVEPIPLTEEALDACLSLDEVMPTEVCQPSDPKRALPHFLDPTIAEYNFCSCALNPPEEDSRKLQPTTLYVEDRRNDASEALGPIYAALQLDIQPGETEPFLKVAYGSYVTPNVALKPVNELQYEPPRRPVTGRELRQLNLGNSEEKIDLCNGNGLPLLRGFHTLRVLVTDAPWFNPTDDEMDREFGVPDLANGATYDTLEYVFYCDDKSNEANPHCMEQCKLKDTSE